MQSFLIFVSACAMIVVIAWLVSKLTGAHARYLDHWNFDDGETTMWRDDRADVAIIMRQGQTASLVRILRLHRWSVIVTNQRVMIACKTLSGRRMVKYVLHLGRALDDQSQRLGGGLLTRGYTTIVMDREVLKAPNNAWVALRPLASAKATASLAELRIYTEVPKLTAALTLVGQDPRE